MLLILPYLGNQNTFKLKLLLNQCIFVVQGSLLSGKNEHSTNKQKFKRLSIRSKSWRKFHCKIIIFIENVEIVANFVLFLVPVPSWDLKYCGKSRWNSSAPPRTCFCCKVNTRIPDFEWNIFLFHERNRGIFILHFYPNSSARDFPISRCFSQCSGLNKVRGKVWKMVNAGTGT